MPTDIRDYVTNYRQDKRVTDTAGRAALESRRSAGDDPKPASFGRQFSADAAESRNDWSGSSMEADMGLGF